MKTLCTKRLVASTLAVLMSLSSISCAAGLRKESTTTSEQGATVEPPLETEKKPTNRPSNQPDPDPETEILPEIPETDTDSVLLPETEPETDHEIETQIPPASQPEDETETSVTAEPETEKHRHAYGEWVTTKDPSCTADGEQARYCDCGKVQTMRITAEGHSYSVTVTPPTATENGLKESHCDSCGYDRMEAIVPTPYAVVSAHRDKIGYTGKDGEILVIPAVFQDGDTWYRVTEIGRSAFYRCTNLSKVIIPDGVTSIGVEAFSGCYALTSVEIPDSELSIGEFAFYNCDKLTSMTIPASVTSIGGYAFGNCYSLSSIYYTGSESQWNAIAKGLYWDYNIGSNYGGYTAHFDDRPSDALAAGLIAHSIDTFLVNGKMYFEQDGGADQKLTAIDNTIIFAAGETHNSMALRGWIGFTQPIAYFGYQVNDSQMVWGNFTEATEEIILQVAGEHATRYRIQVPLADLGAGTHTVGFYIRLQDGTVVHLRENLTVFIEPPAESEPETEGHRHAFGKWTYSAYPSCTDYGERYRSCACGATETEIVSAYGHSYSQGATVPPTATEDGYTEYWCSVCGYGYADAIIPVDFEITADNRHMIGFTGAFGEELVIPAVFRDGDMWYRVKRIGKGAFYGRNLIAVTIPDSVTVIGDYAFSYCGALGFVAVPESVTVIGEWAFYSCGLSAFSIPSGVTDIAPYTFYACISLTSISIPDGVTSIGESAFLNCINLTSIDYMGSESQWSAISKGIDWDTDAGINYGGYTVHYGYAPSVVNLTIPQEQWVVSGHMPSIVTIDQSNYSGMLNAAGVKSAALLHQGSIGLGKIDLSLYSKVVVYWGSDASDVTINAYNANANNRFMLVTTDKNGLMSPDESTVIAATTYRLHGWYLKAVEIDLNGVDYSGPVFLTNDSLPGNFTLVYSIEFVV